MDKTYQEEMGRIMQEEYENLRQLFRWRKRLPLPIIPNNPENHHLISAAYAFAHAASGKENLGAEIVPLIATVTEAIVLRWLNEKGLLKLPEKVGKDGKA